MSNSVDEGVNEMFQLDYNAFLKHYADPFRGGKYAGFLEDTLHILGEQSFVKEHELFYPKGMFNDEEEELAACFFTNKTLHVVTIETEQMIVKSWNNTEIYSVELIIPDRFNLGLVIHLKDGEKIEFNSKLDTNANGSTRFKDKINEIHKLLTNN